MHEHGEAQQALRLTRFATTAACRFQVYEHGEEPPPMSPPANKGMQEGLAGSFSRTSDARLSDSAAETPRYRPTLAPSEAAELTAAAAAATAAAGTTGGGVPAAGGTSIPAGGTGALTPLGGAGGSSGTPPPSLPGALAAAAAAPSVGALPPLAPANTAALPPGVTSSGGSAMISAGAAVVPSSTGGGVLPPAAVLPAVSGEDSAAAAETKRRGRFKIIEEDGPGRLTPGRTPSSSDLVMAKLLGKGAGAASGEAAMLEQACAARVMHCNRVLSSCIAAASVGSVCIELQLPAMLVTDQLSQQCRASTASTRGWPAGPKYGKPRLCAGLL
jgi:hypothetical protein